MFAVASICVFFSSSGQRRLRLFRVFSPVRVWSRFFLQRGATTTASISGFFSGARSRPNDGEFSPARGRGGCVYFGVLLRCAFLCRCFSRAAQGGVRLFRFFSPVQGLGKKMASFLQRGATAAASISVFVSPLHGTEILFTSMAYGSDRRS